MSRKGTSWFVLTFKIPYWQVAAAGLNRAASQLKLKAESTLKWIQGGLIAATIAQKPFTMAYYGLKMLDDLYHHKLPSLTQNWSRDPFSVLPTIVDTGATMVDQSNVGEFIKAQETTAGAPKS